MRSAALLGLFLALGCGDSSDPAAAVTPKAVVALRFTVSSSVRSSTQITDPLKGRVFGSVYLAEDVNIGGPRVGAEPVAAVDMFVDVTNAGNSEPTRLAALPENRYAFLGFFDVDGNGAESKKPDKGDPVTLPNAETQFEVTGTTELDALVTFNLVYDG